MPSSSAGTIQCHQVVLVVELVEASLFPHVLVWHVWPMHQVVPVVELVEAFHMSGFGMCGQLWPMHQKEQLLQLTFPVQTIHIVST
jgi:hypothetical protein